MLTLFSPVDLPILITRLSTFLDLGSSGGSFQFSWHLTYKFLLKNSADPDQTVLNESAPFVSPKRISSLKEFLFFISIFLSKYNTSMRYRLVLFVSVLLILIIFLSLYYYVILNLAPR